MTLFVAMQQTVMRTLGKYSPPEAGGVKEKGLQRTNPVKGMSQFAACFCD